MRILLLKILCVFIIGGLLVVGCKKKQDASSDDIRRKLDSGQMQAPAFTLKDQNGEEFKLSDHIGNHIIVLEWLNYDCPFVLAHYESGKMVAVAEKFKDEGVFWVSVNSTHYATPEANADFIEKFQIPYQILDDSGGDVGRLYKATNTPQVYVINKAGLIVYNGAVDNAHKGRQPEVYEAYLETVLTELIDGGQLSYYHVRPVGCTVKYAK